MRQARRSSPSIKLHGKIVIIRYGEKEILLPTKIFLEVVKELRLTIPLSVTGGKITKEAHL